MSLDATMSHLRRWREVNGIIHFPVISNGMTGAEWLARIEREGQECDSEMRGALLSPLFKPTIGKITSVAVLRGTFFSYRIRTMPIIHAMAEALGLVKPDPEVACLIADKFNEGDLCGMDMDNILIMHAPIPLKRGPVVFRVRGENGCWWWHDDDNYGRCQLSLGWGRPRSRFRSQDNFAFAYPHACDHLAEQNY